MTLTCLTTNTCRNCPFLHKIWWMTVIQSHCILNTNFFCTAAMSFLDCPGMSLKLISKTRITEHLDSVVNSYIQKWLDILISGTLSNVFLERNTFGLNICPPSIKFTQCQTVLLNSLKESPNNSLKDLWKSSSCHTNIQYDMHKSIKEVLKDFRSNQEDKMQHHLTFQGFFFSNVKTFKIHITLNSYSIFEK